MFRIAALPVYIPSIAVSCLFATAFPALVHADTPFSANTTVPHLMLTDPSALTLDAQDNTLPPSSDRTKLSFYFENDAISTLQTRTDRHYTNGMGISWATQCSFAREIGSYLPSILPNEFDAHDGNNTFAIGLGIYQQMYTPEDITQTQPLYFDRPFAGWFYGSLYFQRANEGKIASYENIQFDAGLVGKDSLAEYTQKWWHGMFGFRDPAGWGNQIPDEPEFDFVYQRKERIDVFNGSMIGLSKLFQAQVIPEFSTTLGTLKRTFDGQIMGRIGWNLFDDFGPGRVFEVASATGHKGSGMSVYLFGRAEIQYVEHNVLVEGDNWRSSPVTQGAMPWVWQEQLGVAFAPTPWTEVAYSTNFVSKEFRGQYNQDGFGAITFSFIWTW